ncbi:MAG: 5-amino-6-(D-ribitylamino)uracil--L-tyrosine 4-hydroxyphenyl transferase CofH [Gammaproteobacteria bacterium]|nr:5-amino-6-(D-ribitylamino)uracil--L-tyrosine 4-hydroxyphenyl transferase CofH [Gammaproteobacteria bacterium]
MWIVLPLKATGPVKSRLAKVLSPEQRHGLMTAMVRDVLVAAAACPDVDGILLVSKDPDVSSLADDCGADMLSLEQDKDLNSAVTAATDHLYDRGVARALVLHGDMPLMRPSSLTQIIEQGRHYDLALLPCRHGQGSNAMLVSLPAKFRFQYGCDSFQRHRADARRLGLDVGTLDEPDLALDVNSADDLEALCQRYRNDDSWRDTHTFGFLTDLGFLHDNVGILDAAMSGQIPGADQARSLALAGDMRALVSTAATLRDRAHGNLVSYSKKVFIPLTRLCRDVCHYCTYAKVPRHAGKPYMSIEEVLEIARQGAEAGCREALLTLGDKPELRYKTARDALSEMGFATTLEYVAHVAKAIREETGLLPQINAGCMDDTEIAMLRKVSPSMGIMLESASERLCDKGMPHHGSPDKLPARRLETIALAGQANVPFTSGILIGIGETRLERIESLLALRDLHDEYGHLQEVIIQNFRAKPDTLMANAPEPDQEELRWTVAVARIIFGAQMNIQAPPNLVPESLEAVIEAGINDLGGMSPLTPDFVNPEAPWPHLGRLEAELAASGRQLQQRLTLYPAYARNAEKWVAPEVLPRVLQLADGEGFAREDEWLSGISTSAPTALLDRIYRPGRRARRLSTVRALLQRCQAGGAESLRRSEIARLFAARGEDFGAVCQAADHLRAEVNGNSVSYVSNRNINYTNICYFKCKFCAFSKGKVAEGLRDKPYDLDLDEIQRRTIEARKLGATEVCLQGGIHPDYTGQHYIDICHAVKDSVPDMHIHAFSPLEVWQGAETLGVSLPGFLERLHDAGLGSLPGTAAEILNDDVRKVLCADKVSSAQWLEVMETAHGLGLPTTATIMFGHVDRYEHWAEHLLAVRDLQARTGGFTEFVPLPFVAQMAPMYRRGQSRRGPTFREAILMHAVARLVLHPHVTNVQASWVKMGLAGVQACLHAGANDIGGTLIDESITRSAGASHGQCVGARELQELAIQAGRVPWQRTTLYKVLPTDLVSMK